MFSAIITDKTFYRRAAEMIPRKHVSPKSSKEPGAQVLGVAALVDVPFYVIHTKWRFLNLLSGLGQFTYTVLSNLYVRLFRMIHSCA